MLKFSRISLLTLALLFSAIVTMGIADRNAHGGKSDLPRGKWTLTTYPDVSPEAKNMPVVVRSVTTDVTKGASVTSVEVLNRSNNAVAEVKIAWVLSSEEKPDMVLQQGETQFISVSGSLQARSKKVMDFSTAPVVSFAKIAKRLLKADTLSGGYQITLIVSEVVYEDGSTWRRSDTSQVALRQISLRKTSASTVEQFCPKQRCKVASDASGTGLTCESITSQRTRCSLSIDGRTCTLSLCDGEDDQAGI